MGQLIGNTLISF